jgi:Nif-specific regulatory protein
VAEDVASSAARVTGGYATAAASGTPAKLDESLDRLERELIVNALRATRGNRAQAARLLGVTERVMGLRVKKHGIDCWALRKAPR